MASRYIFPAIYALSLANNCVSFAVITRSNIRQTSTGVYLAVLAWADNLAITLVVSQWWYLMEYGRDFVPVCHINQFLRFVCLNFASVCVLCVTVDRFIAVWFPIRAKFLTTRRNAVCVIGGSLVFLIAMSLPSLIGMTPNCRVRWSFMRSYLVTGTGVLVNFFYSYGTSVCLLMLNIAIATRLVYPDKNLRSNAGSNVSTRFTKVGVTALAVSVAFLVCCSPYNIISSTWTAKLSLTSDPYMDEIIITIACGLSLCNHTINFYLYVLTSNSFRDTLLSILCGPWDSPESVINRRSTTNTTTDSV